MTAPSRIEERLARLDIGHIVREARQRWHTETGLPPAAITEHTGVALTALYGIEGGATDPRLSTVARLSAALPIEFTLAGGRIAAKIIEPGREST